MNQLNQEQIKRFANNTELNEAVKEVLLKTFMKEKSGADVNILASQTLAINLLHEAWREIEEYKNRPQTEDNQRSQIGI